MSTLRWILLGIGLMVIAAVYFWSRRRERPAAPAPVRRPPVEPYFGEAESAVVAEEPAPASSVEAAAAPAEAAPGRESENLILTLSVVPRATEGFAAAATLDALAAAGLCRGRFEIYHFANPDGGGADWFSAASMLEPGEFPDAESDAGVPGITLFLVLPGPAQPHAALDAMLAAARRLAADLDGDLEDARHKPFTALAAQRMREQLGEWRVRSEAF